MLHGLVGDDDLEELEIRQKLLAAKEELFLKNQVNKLILIEAVSIIHGDRLPLKFSISAYASVMEVFFYRKFYEI